MSELGIIDNVDINSEQHLISAIKNVGFAAWAEISDIILPSTFVADSHQCFFKVADYLFKLHGDVKLDWPTFLSGANANGLSEFFNRKEEKQYFKELEGSKIELSNVKMLGTKLRKLEVTRQLRAEIQKADLELAKITGDEKLSEILGKVENPMSNFSQFLRGIDNNGPELILRNLGAYLDNLESNPVEQVGISTGFKRWDKSIGGGLLPGSVSLIGARMKTGKTMLCDNIAYNIISQGIPCLILDAEMVHKQHYNRLLAKISKVPITEVKTGQYSKCDIKKEKVRLSQKILETLPYHYLSISSQSFEETLSEVKRWILNTVKLNSSGKANPCVIILDYLKVMSASSISESMKEYQLLGIYTSSFIDMAIKYDLACLSFLQLNREGIKSEETSVFAGSDRIGMSCSNASIFKVQTDAEIEKQRDHNPQVIYNRKLLCKFARDGEAHEDGDYINVNFERSIANMTEGPSLFELEAQGYNRRNQGNVVEEDDVEVDF